MSARAVRDALGFGRAEVRSPLKHMDVFLRLVHR